MTFLYCNISMKNILYRQEVEANLVNFAEKIRSNQIYA